MRWVLGLWGMIVRIVMASISVSCLALIFPSVESCSVGWVHPDWNVRGIRGYILGRHCENVAFSSLRYEVVSSIGSCAKLSGDDSLRDAVNQHTVTSSTGAGLSKMGRILLSSLESSGWSAIKQIGRK